MGLLSPIKMANKEFTDDASRIKKILEKGYYIALWPNAFGDLNYYLVKNGETPDKGIYLCPKEKSTNE